MNPDRADNTQPLFPVVETQEFARMELALAPIARLKDALTNYSIKTPDVSEDEKRIAATQLRAIEDGTQKEEDLSTEDSVRLARYRQRLHGMARPHWFGHVLPDLMEVVEYLLDDSERKEEVLTSIDNMIVEVNRRQEFGLRLAEHDVQTLIDNVQHIVASLEGNQDLPRAIRNKLHELFADSVHAKEKIEKEMSE